MKIISYLILIFFISVTFLSLNIFSDDIDIYSEEFVEGKSETVTPTPGTNDGLLEIKKQILDLESKQNERTDLFNLYSVIALCTLMVITLLCTLWIMTRIPTPPSAREVVNVIGLIIIVFGTIILMLVSETEQQLTAAIGILGAIAGYLFGTMSRGTGSITETTKDTN